MPINRLYHTLLERIVQLRGNERVTRLRNMAWLMAGIFTSRSVHLSRIANTIPGSAKLVSVVQRLNRFLNNPAIRVREWYAPVVCALIGSMAKSTGQVRLIADGSKVAFRHRLLMVAIAYRRRAIPLVWTWVRSPKGHRSGVKQRALLAYLWRLIPPGVPVLLVGDSEFGSVGVIRQLEAWGWQYVLRQQGSHLVKLAGEEDWRPFSDMIRHEGQSIWLESSLLTQKHVHLSNLLAHWETGEDEPWLLATNLPNRRETLRAYRRRMWMEGMFGDLKGKGFELEKSHLEHFSRLSRLTLAVVLLYVWLVSVGARVIKSGQRHLVDRKGRRDLSIFQIGLRWIIRRLINGQPIPVPLSPV